MPASTPQRTFRLPQRTLEQLDYLVEKGVGKSGTEAVIISIEHLATEYQLSKDLPKVFNLLSTTEDGKKLLKLLLEGFQDEGKG